MGMGYTLLVTTVKKTTFLPDSRSRGLRCRTSLSPEICYNGKDVPAWRCLSCSPETPVKF